MTCPECKTRFDGTVCPVCGAPALRNYEAAVQCVVNAGYAATSLIQRRLKIGYVEAAQLMDEMELHGIIGPYCGPKPREVLIAHKDPAAEAKIPTHTPVTPRRAQARPSSGIRLADCDVMEGHDFEYLCAEILKANGYEHVAVTKASGDQGIDILADKSGSLYAIQCKCYASPIGNHAVQEAFAGAAFYDGRIPVVMTNQTFTASAQELAAKTKVVLWDRGELERMISVYNGTPQGTAVSYNLGTKASAFCLADGQRRSYGKFCNKWVSFFLCLFFGYLGAHKFYEGKSGMGCLYLVTFGLLGIGWLVDTVLIFKKPNPYFSS